MKTEDIAENISNDELINRVQTWLKKMLDKGGSAWCLHVPVDLKNDPDILITELCKRLKQQPHPQDSSSGEVEKALNSVYLQLGVITEAWREMAVTNGDGAILKEDIIYQGSLDILKKYKPQEIDPNQLKLIIPPPASESLDIDLEGLNCEKCQQSYGCDCIKESESQTGGLSHRIIPNHEMMLSPEASESPEQLKEICQPGNCAMFLEKDQCKDKCIQKESLEQAAESYVNKLYSRNQPDYYTQRKKLNTATLEMEAREDAFKSGAHWQSTQQQKPIAVALPDENDFMVWFKEMKYDRKTFDFAKSIWNEAVKKLSAANGVDLEDLHNWINKNKWTFERTSNGKFLWFKDMKYPPNQIGFTLNDLVKEYLTDQSQQQNKGTK